MKPKITSQTTTTNKKKGSNDDTDDKNHKVRAVMKKVIEDLAIEKEGAGTAAGTACKKNSSKQIISTACVSDNKKKLFVGLRQTSGSLKDILKTRRRQTMTDRDRQ